MYVLQENQVINGKSKNITILETFSLINVIKTLADMLGGG